jgi:hypothetical protein
MGMLEDDVHHRANRQSLRSRSLQSSFIAASLINGEVSWTWIAMIPVLLFAICDQEPVSKASYPIAALVLKLRRTRRRQLYPGFLSARRLP